MGSDISTKAASGPPPPATVQPTAARSLPETNEKRKDAVVEDAKKAEGKASLDEVVSGLNDMVQNLHRHLQFSVEEKTGETIIKVVDSETNQVVRQIPSEEIVRLRQRMKEAAGVLFQGAV